MAGNTTFFGSINLPHVFIDEVSQSVEPELLIPLCYGARHVVLFGDQHQLGPVVKSRWAVQREYNQSLFARLVKTKACELTMLDMQYRMHPSIAAFPSEAFYDNTLYNGVTAEQRSAYITPVDPNGQYLAYDNDKADHIFPWPDPSQPFAFISAGSYETDELGSSKSNRIESDYVEALLCHFISKGVNLKSIGVITPYEGQRTHILRRLTDDTGRFTQVIHGLLNDDNEDFSIQDTIDLIERDLEVSSVDAFQGREKDLIIFSSVRTVDLGFLRDIKRLNVAITRAKHGLIMIGAHYLLQRDPTWGRLLNHFRANDAFIKIDGGKSLFEHTLLHPLQKPYTSIKALRAQFRRKYGNDKIIAQ
jgi:regulator of nonsense transcripts 1